MDTINNLLNKASTVVIYPIMVVVFAAAFFMFMWGLFQFLVNLSKGANVEEGKSHMLWGTIGMFIMVSGYGIVSLIDHTLDSNMSDPAGNASTIINSVQLH